MLGTEQPPHFLSGEWEGHITQEDFSGITEYEIYLKLNLKGEIIEGKSFVFDGDTYAEFKIQGDIKSGLFLTFIDIEKIQFVDIPGAEWCFKKYQLVVQRKAQSIELNGTWRGHTTFSDCVPGKIYLKRCVKRA